MAPKQKYILSAKAAPLDNATISHQLVQFGLSRGASSYYKLGLLYDVSEAAIKHIVEKGEVSEYAYAKKIAGKMGLFGKARKDFFLRAGWLEDKEHAIEALREKKAPLWMAILSLCAAQGKTEEDMRSFLQVPQGTYHGWVNSTTQRNPPREYMLKMAGDKCFDFNREETEIFLEAADRFIDKAHVVSALRGKRIVPLRAAKGFMEIEAGDITEYAKKIKEKRPTVASWCCVSIPRERLIALISDLPVEDQRYVMERSGHFLDPKHVAERFKDSSDPTMYIMAFKDMYDLGSDGFGISKTSITSHRNASQKPKVESLIKQFATVEKEHPEMKDCWDAYKLTCARFAGHEDGSQASALYMRQMTEGRQAQLNIGKI